ncbi:hypothetical protein ACFPPF_06595 [Xenophilus aerolatus]|nr:hypothetical protein [Xenophilus aerolatus]
MALTLLLASFGLIAAGGWNWFAKFLESSAPNWIQAIGSIAAIVSAGLFVQWQLRRQGDLAERNRVDAEVHRLQLIGAALFHCRVAAYRVQNPIIHAPVDEELHDLRVQLHALRATPLVDHPDWRSLHGVAYAAGTLDGVYERVLEASRRLSPSGPQDLRRHMNSVVHSLELAEELVQDALKDRGSDLHPIGMSIDGERLVSRSYPVR